MIPLGVLAAARPSGSEYVTDGLAVHLDSLQHSGSGTWMDISGSGRHATLVGTVTQDAGMVAFESASYASIPYQLPGDSFTVEAAMRFVTPSGWCPVFAAESWDAASGYLALFEGNILRFRRGQDNGGVEVAADWTTFHVMAFVKAGPLLIIYINGALVATRATDTTAVNNATTYLSARHGNAGTGVADARSSRYGEARLYSRALTAEEVAQNFEASRGRYGL